MITAVQNYKNNTPNFGSMYQQSIDLTKSIGLKIINSTLSEPLTGDFARAVFENLPTIASQVLVKNGKGITSFDITEIKNGVKGSPIIIGELSRSRGGVVFKHPTPVEVRAIRNPYTHLAPNGYTFDLSKLVESDNGLGKKLDTTI